MTTTFSTLTPRDTVRAVRWPVNVLSLTALIILPACSSSTAFMQNSVNGVAETVEYAALPSPAVETMATPAAASADEEQAAGRVTLNRPSPSRPSVKTAILTQDPSDKPSSPSIIPLSHELTPTAQQCEPPCFTPAEPRVAPAQCCQSPAQMYPDEYLCDGGDRNLPVHYFAGDRQGFDTEDTIAEYSDHDGESHVRASNPVCIYAPRFGSVEVIEGANSGIQIHHASNATEFSVVGSLERQDAIHQSVKEDGFRAVRSRRRADGAEAQKNVVLSTALKRPQRNDKIDQGLQAESISGMQILERQQGAQFHQELANAIVWSRDLFPEISAATSQAGQIRARASAQAAIGIDDQRAKKSHIHIVKLADREQAEAGDTIHFTIRFINTGDYDLYNVRIVDNLTPRLLLIPDSVESDREGEFLTQPNGEGSDILTFELDEALPAHKSGTIKFAVRVQ